jgi:hypothetical protein
LLGAIFAASCLANPQRPGKQDKGVVQSKQNKKQQTLNKKQKTGRFFQNAQQIIALGNAKSKKRTINRLAKTKNGIGRNRQKNEDTVKPGMVMMTPSSNKTASSYVGGAVAAGAALAGGAAVMSMPAISSNDEVQDGGDDSNAPPGALGIDLLSMPPMSKPADLLSSDHPPNISPDADAAEASEQKIKWLTSRFLQNKPFSLDDPELNLTVEEKSIYAKQLSILPQLFGIVLNGGALGPEAADAIASAAAANFVKLFAASNSTV